MLLNIGAVDLQGKRHLALPVAGNGPLGEPTATVKIKLVARQIGHHAIVAAKKCEAIVFDAVRVGQPPSIRIFRCA